MRLRVLSLPLLLLLLLLAATASAPVASAKHALHDIEESIYTTLEADDACVTLLNRDGAVGCSTDGSRIGRLHRVRTLSDLEALLASNLGSSELLALLMPRELLRHANLPLLRQVPLAGILLEPIAPLYTPYSPAARSPLRHLAPTASASFDWNPHGDAFIEERLQFAVLQLSERSWPSMRQRAEANADGTASGSGNFVEFRYVMKARSNSVECLRDGLCVPIGNFNVWASLGGPRAQNLSKPIVLATATLDANALFHTLARGADAHASGLVALLVAADAVAKLGWTELSKLDKQIVVTFFNAETFDLIGSRSFVKDTSGSFKCERASSNGRFCIKPFRSDRAFENIALDKVEALLELSQVALEQQPLVFAHSHSTSAAHSLLSHLRSASASSGIEVRTPSNVSHRLPPSSAWSFVSQVPDIDAIVLAEHDAAYSNAFYHSVLDRNITANAAHRLCQLSTMTARTLLLSAGASNSTAASVSSNCTHIDELLYCLTSNFDCPLSRRLLPASVLLSSLPDVRRSASRGTSRYAGAYEPGRVLADLVSGATRLVFEQLQESSADLAPAASTAGANVCESASNCANSEWCRAGKCAVRTTHYHDAVDPALAFDGTTGTWSIVDLHSNSRIWCESNWATLMSRAFIKETSLSAHLMLFGGVLIALLTVVVAKGFAPSYAATRFKLD